MSPILIAVLGLVGVAVTAAVNFYLGRRSTSGSVETTEAKDLWDAMRGEMTRLQQEAAALRAELAVARGEIQVLREELAETRSIARKEIAVYRVELAETRKRLHDLEAAANG